MVCVCDIAYIYNREMEGGVVDRINQTTGKS